VEAFTQSINTLYCLLKSEVMVCVWPCETLDSVLSGGVFGELLPFSSTFSFYNCS